MIIKDAKYFFSFLKRPGAQNFHIWKRIKGMLRNKPEQNDILICDMNPSVGDKKTSFSSPIGF